ncbi:hypothetical protein RHECNPAF_43007 [Rhizobium etli CNPAF512]|nr:hypothetical protein RHECNPAF_43007 [Rhizobium etli CNPAF512]
MTIFQTMSSFNLPHSSVNISD